jgi:hypothetical protein
MLAKTSKLLQALAAGVQHIGEIVIQTRDANGRVDLCHVDDMALSAGTDAGCLTIYDGPAAARSIASYAGDGSYRCLKAQPNLQRGWLLRLYSVEDLRLALDQFYPASLGLWLAQQDGTLEVTHLRDTLQRQSGMYRRAQSLSTAAIQQLVPRTCSPAVPCARRILWQIDAQTPLLPSPASRCSGMPDNVPAATAIPLLCREACNHFVAACLASANAAAAQHP